MAMKNLLIEINEDVKDILRMGFELTRTQSEYVPNDEDQGLTFESGKVKKAKLIDTCILYADIRNSTALSNSNTPDIMAKLYTAFISSACYIAQHHGGIVRNIIGDRVMVVFPNKNCFANAIDTAISINTVSQRIINKHFVDFHFEVGIGIDFGEMKVIKTGISKHGKERSSHKNLVWIGEPANIASKLTDIANKEIVKTIYRVKMNPSNPSAFRCKMTTGFLPWPIPGQFERVENQPLYLDKIETIDLSPEEFAGKIIQIGEKLDITNGKILNFKRETLKTKGKPILMTQKVWEEYSKANPNATSVIKKFWQEQNINVKEYSGKIYGGDVCWTAIDEINL